MAGKRVLVVDDNQTLARLVKRRLERDGHTVTTMNSSMDALAAIDAGERFDVYVLDVNMQQGEPHGLALARMLELRQSTAAVIFITGNLDLAAGDDFVGRTVLEKPFDFDDLCRAVAELPRQT